MKIVFIVLLAQLQEILPTTFEPDHVHLKIHVPEVIKQHFHTRIVFVHQPDKQPQKPASEEDMNYHKESHFEDWSSWNNYGQDGGHHRFKNHKNLPNHRPNSEAEREVFHDPEAIRGVFHDPEAVRGVFHEFEAEKPVYEEQSEDYPLEMSHNSIETFMEDSYRGGSKTAGHSLTNEQENFYGDNQDEADEEEHGYHHEEQDHHSNRGHNRYDKVIGYKDRVGSNRANRKYYIF